MVMMLLTCVDVVLRLSVTVYHEYHWIFFSHFKPIAGTYELISFLGTVSAAFAMAHTSLEKGHVAVSLVVRLLPERVQGLIGSVTDFFGFFFFALIAWRSALYGNHLRASGEVSLTLQLPFYPFVYGIGFASAAVCLVLLTDFSKNAAKAVGK